MPKAAKQPKLEDDTKPYPSPSASSSPPKQAASPSKQSAKKWSKEDKIDLLVRIVSAAAPDWQAIADDLGGGRTKSQVHDQWRQHILPTLKKEGRVSKME